MTLLITLTWPEPSLWPNSRRHWTQRARDTRDARYESKIVTLAAILRGHCAYAGGAVTLTITGHKPRNRKVDATNLQSALKAAIDGIADALGVDDSVFVATTRWGAADPPRGSVTVAVGT